MTYQLERSTIEGFFGPLWNNRTPVGYDARNFTPTHQSIQIDILSGEGFQKSMGAPGSNIARYAGVVAIRVYTTEGTSSDASRKIEDDICGIFRNKRVGNILFRVPYVSGREFSPPWLVRTVMVPFHRDEAHA